MAGNKNSGRNKKPTIEKIKNGTFRKDRDSEQQVLEKTFSNAGIILTPDTVIEPPSEITDSFVQDYYRFHTKQLIQLQVLSLSDLPELNQLYVTLQELRNINKQLQETSITTDFESYEKLVKIQIRLSALYSQLCSKYLISPSARNKIAIEQLTVSKMSEEKSVIGKLMAGNK